MEPKKNPKADLRKRSLLFFQLGLIAVLALTYFTIEYKNYDRSGIDIGQLDLDDELDEEIPITELNTPPPPPPPPPPPAPEIIEVVEDEEEIEETVIESTETDADEEIVEVEEVEVAEIEEEIAEVPFSIIENVPIFPGCEGEKNNDARRKCMSDAIDKIISKKFDTELGSELGLSGVQRIYVLFKIDERGNVVDVRARAPHPKLQSEAQRVVNLLPKMTPGKQRGKPVRVSYTKPIVFKIED